MNSLLVFASLFAIGIAQDLQCTSQGGECLDWRYYICTAGYESGLCSGDSNRRCCMNCDNACLIAENGYDDSACESAGGKCLDNSNYCPDGYTSGLCEGPSTRQCCGASDTSGGGGGPSLGQNKCYGNVNNIETDGASSQTASQDGLSGGVSASNQMAQTDSNRMDQYRSLIQNSASKYCIQESVIAGIISRESRAGAALDSNGLGDNGNGYGLMQIDKRYHTVEGGPYSQAHIDQGTRILIDMIGYVEADHPTWTTDMNLKGGICAYNSGPGNVQTYEGMDIGTTGNDYSDDVVARAQWYYSQDGYND